MSLLSKLFGSGKKYKVEPLAAAESILPETTVIEDEPATCHPGDEMDLMRKKEDECPPEKPDTEKVDNEASNVVIREYQKPSLDLYSEPLKEAYGSDAFVGQESPCTFLLGTDEKGVIHTADLAELNNLLIIGSLGTGKTNFVDSYLLSVVNKASPKDVRLVIISAKPNELTQYQVLPHLFCPIITDTKKGCSAIRWVKSEAEARTKKLYASGVRNIEQYNKKVPEDERFPRLVVVIDGIDILKYGADDTEEVLFEVLSSGSKAGVHFVVAATHLGYNTFSLRCQSCIPNRVSFRTVTGRQSLAGIGIHGAERLVGLGKMLFSSIFIEEPIELQAFNIDMDTIDNVMNSFVCDPYIRPAYADLTCEPSLSALTGLKDEDDMLPDAVRLVIENKQASVSMLQRRLRIGYARASNMIDRMEQLGYISRAVGDKPRQVFIDEEDYKILFG